MKKGTGVFQQVEKTKTVCDKCGKDVDIVYEILIDAVWSDGYDTYGDKYDFCSLECAIKHMQDVNLPPENEDISIYISTRDFSRLLVSLQGLFL